VRANFIHIQPFVQQVIERRVPGAFAEFGVWHATTFMPLAELARLDGRVIHAVDSFQGMAASTERDGEAYQAGALSVGGSQVFRKLARPYGETIRLHEGYVPQVLDEMKDAQFAFVHLDLDQYRPTLESLRWLWPRMAQCGIVAVHDWFPGRHELAAGAVADWSHESGVGMTLQTKFNHAIFTKGGLHDREEPNGS